MQSSTRRGQRGGDGASSLRSAVEKSVSCPVDGRIDEKKSWSGRGKKGGRVEGQKATYRLLFVSFSSSCAAFPLKALNDRLSITVVAGN